MKTKRNEQVDREADRRYRAKLVRLGAIKPDNSGRYTGTGLTPIHIPAHAAVFHCK